jgi:ribonuclease P protein component
MKPEIRRLKTRPDFLRVAAARRKKVTPGLILQAARRTGASVPFAQRPHVRGRPAALEWSGSPEAIRVGFTASRKVGKAVARNRARRRLRAAAAQILPEMGQPGHDYVLVARAGTLTRRYADLVADLRAALASLDNEGTQPRPYTGRRRRPAGPRTKEGGGERS